MKKMKKGFTLIELMIVVAIIGVLAAVAIPKFADLIRKAQEAACKGQLGAMRSALSIYYGNEEGVWPQVSASTNDTVLSAAIAPTYIQAIPNAKPGLSNFDTARVSASTVGTVGPTNAPNGWWYNSGGSNGTGEFAGAFKVNSDSTDTKGTVIHAW